MSVNKVLSNIPQSLDNNEKQQARSNIDAARIISVSVPGTTGYSGDLQFNYDNVTQTYDVSVNNQEIGTVISSPNVTGTVLTCNNNGTITWETPNDSIYIESESYDMNDYAGNVETLDYYTLPTHNGKYPTKVIGSFYCNPRNGYNTISVIPCATATYIDGEYNLTPYDTAQNINVKHLLTLEDQYGEGQYTNTVTFQFHKSPTVSTNMTYIAIKGQASAIPSDYGINGVNLTYFFER